MTDSAEQRQALERLQKQLLEFILEHATRRISAGDPPQLSQALASLIEGYARNGVRQALAEARIPALGITKEPTPFFSPEPVRPADVGMEADGDPKARRPRRQRLDARNLTTILVSILALVLFVVAVFQAMESRRAGKDQANTTAARERALSELCDYRRRLVDQAALVQDTVDFKKQCTDKTGADHTPSCELVTLVASPSEPGPCP